MAIIYTYPALSNPQGNELIVVSDVNNRNSTRLITIASIAALLPSGGGCSTAITGIIDAVDNPLYEATLCNDVRFVSTDGSVSFAATAGNDGVDFSVAGSTLSCATPTQLGGIKISAQYATEDIPAPITSNFTVHPIETTTNGSVDDECTAVVRIPVVNVDCATRTTNGTIKVGTGLANNITIADSGEYYAVQVDSECLASVRVPASSSGCSDVFKTIKNSTGTFTFDASGCDDILTFGSTQGTVEITSTVNGTINLNAIGAEAQVLNGFSPLDIYSGTTLITSNLTIAQQTISDVNLTGVNTVDFVALNDNANRTIQCHLWEGKMNDSGSATFLGSGSLTGVSKGINTITLSTFNLSAGTPIVIYFTADKLGDGNVDTIQLLVGEGLSGADFLCQSSNAYTTTPSNDLTTALTPLSEADEMAGKRVACHFYKS